ncbi:SBBP repeat-containing protein [Hymenobacter sp.]|uniref:SBBP repeat-containing protein n=1 Tax=Hymenobacter sp. TaxID=1898978 RepID=UPI00286C0A97|nr:SBBP repeat-containing protein [Hymenobacter sp.]
MKQFYSFTARPWLRTVLAAAGLCLAAAAQAQTPAWSNASRVGGAGLDAGAAIAVDAAGNTYVAGRFSSATVTIGSTTLNNVGNGADVFVAKYSPAGGVLWATRFGGTGEDYPDELAVDAAGNVYVAGTFFSSSFAVGGTTLANAGSGDMFLARLSAAGVPQWGVRAGGPGDDFGTAVALDDDGFVWLGGQFQGTATVTGTATTLVSAGGRDNGLVKVNTAGTYVRMGRAGGAGSEFLQGIATAGAALYVTGNFDGATLPVGTTTLTRRCTVRDGFLIKYDRFLDLTWARSEGSTGATTYANYAVAADLDGTVVTGGEFQGTVVVGNFDTIINTGASPAPMVVRYAAAGNVTAGRSSNGSLGFGRVTGLARDAAGATYVTGRFSGIVRWSLAEVTSAGGTDVFVAKLPATGNASWAVRAGGSANDEAGGLALDAAAHCYLTGSFNGAATFGALPALASAGQDDAFVARLGGTALATRAAQTATPLDAWPNPVGPDRVLRLALPAASRGGATLRLLDAVGRVAHAQAVPASAVLTLPATLAPGRYLAEVRAGETLLRRALLVE